MARRRQPSDICLVRTKEEGKPTAHWWIIEGQHGALSKARCRCCGKKGKFANSPVIPNNFAKTTGHQGTVVRG